MRAAEYHAPTSAASVVACRLDHGLVVPVLRLLHPRQHDPEEHQHDRPDDERDHAGGAGDREIEDQARDADHEQGDDHEVGDQQPVPRADDPLLDLVPEQGAVQRHGGEADHRREARERDQHEVQGELVPVELVEPGLERDGEQEAADQLGSGEGHAQLLEDVAPVAVAALVGGLVASVRRVRVAVVAHRRGIGGDGLGGSAAGSRTARRRGGADRRAIGRPIGRAIGVGRWGRSGVAGVHARS